MVIKRLNKDSIIDTLTLRKEIKEMRDLKHPNLTNFIGACLDSPNVAILIELAGKVMLILNKYSLGLLIRTYNNQHFKYKSSASFR